MKKYIFAIFVIVIAGCSATPNLISQPIEVSVENLDQYWEMKHESFSFNSPINVQHRPIGHVKIRYLIDSNGKVFEPEIVDSVPVGVWDDQGMRAVKKMEYLPSGSNLSRDPVYVTTEFHFGGSA